MLQPKLFGWLSKICVGGGYKTLNGKMYQNIACFATKVAYFMKLQKLVPFWKNKKNTVRTLKLPKKTPTLVFQVYQRRLNLLPIFLSENKVPKNANFPEK